MIRYLIKLILDFVIIKPISFIVECTKEHLVPIFIFMICDFLIGIAFGVGIAMMLFPEHLFLDMIVGTICGFCIISWLLYFRVLSYVGVPLLSAILAFGFATPMIHFLANHNIIIIEMETWQHCVLIGVLFIFALMNNCRVAKKMQDPDGFGKHRLKNRKHNTNCTNTQS